MSQATLGRAPSSGLQALTPDTFTMPFEPGQLVNGKYQVIELIGVGGIGFVVAAIHVDLGEKIALKFLRPEALANPEVVGRFAREARAAAQIKSEYVARVFDVGTLAEGGAPFIVMEYLEGKDLGAVLHERGPLPIKLAVEYVLQTCEALACAHASGIVHRDVKPENLFLNQRAQGMSLIKVLDFGISKVALTGSAFENRYPLARTTMPMGSPIYMSPEQIRAAEDIDARADIWSLGCVLYELLTGNPAFDAPSITQVAAIILEREPPPLQGGCPHAPAGLQAIVQRCLAKDPAARFQNVAELAVALYPFGPQRARMTVERCCSILQSAGVFDEGLELPSLPPVTASDPSAPSSMTMSSAMLPHLAPIESHVQARTAASPASSPWVAALSKKKWPIAAGGAGVLAILIAALASRGEPEAATSTAAAPAPAPAASPSPAPASPPAAPAAEAKPAAPSTASAIPQPSSPAPTPAEPASAEAATTAADSDEADDDKPRADKASSTSKPAATPPRATTKQRTPAPQPKPKPAPAPRPAPSAPAEPDVGF